MPYETVLYAVRGPVAPITLNRPVALNAINPQLEAELQEALDGADDDPAVATTAGRRSPAETNKSDRRCAGRWARPRWLQRRDLVRGNYGSAIKPRSTH